MVSFKLNDHQEKVKADARAFALETLSIAPATYSKFNTQSARFRSTRPIYRKAVAAGLIRSQIPAALGGTNTNLLEQAIQLEEYYAVDPSISLTVAATGLGLTPLILAGNQELHEKFLKPFLESKGEPLASLVHSEPGGTANWLEVGGNGLQTTAFERDGSWVINGEKLWTSNSGGWDGKGAELQCVVCRSITSDFLTCFTNDPRTNIVILLVTRETIAQNESSAYDLLDEPELVGHTATSGPHTRFFNFKVPQKNLLASSTEAAALVQQSFGMSAALVGAMAVGIMRAAFEKALKFSRTETRGGSVPILQRQSVADLLIKTKISLDASRLLTWKALVSLENGPLNEHAALESCLQAKIFASECAAKCVISAMKAVGVSSYARSQSFGRLLEDAMCLTLFDGGNVGVRRRQLEKLLWGYDYAAKANL